MAITTRLVRGATMLHLPIVVCRMNFHGKEDSTPITQTLTTDGKPPKVYLGIVQVSGEDSR